MNSVLMVVSNNKIRVSKTLNSLSVDANQRAGEMTGRRRSRSMNKFNSPAPTHGIRHPNQEVSFVYGFQQLGCFVDQLVKEAWSDENGFSDAVDGVSKLRNHFYRIVKFLEIFSKRNIIQVQGWVAIMADENIDVKDEVAEKKKKKVVIQENADEAVDSLAEKTESLSVSDGLESSFTGLKKKKKKPVETSMLDEESGDAGEDLDDHAGEDENGEGADVQQQQRNPWDGTDRDYEYEELLGRVFNILRENNPELAGDRRRTVMRPPQVLREGTKKTVFVNFMDLCRTMHRQADHVMAFLLAELGTSGSLDGQQRLVVKGRFAPKNFEGILRRYINEYVICLGCKSPDTILSKENRLFFLRCEKCGSGRSVAPIKAGFVARVGRRNAGT
ncbi:hypothetical protein OIU85_002959 [Salix viminalis]|uniref:Eukaryotic translation initiation factor 2 subunit beta n=1 Tax=Salix viminalis TaxID=40686 RepID=A0A9Q0PY54_SALVM|nr:hypothetical protein OIU85_002959 [Salix viminalis]